MKALGQRRAREAIPVAYFYRRTSLRFRFTISSTARQMAGWSSGPMILHDRARANRRTTASICRSGSAV